MICMKNGCKFAGATSANIFKSQTDLISSKPINRRYTETVGNCIGARTEIGLVDWCSMVLGVHQKEGANKGVKSNPLHWKH